MNTKTNSTQWASRIADVMSTLDSDLYTPESNSKTGAILESCRKRLASGQSLSPKQSAALVEAIRLRADSGFVWTGEVAMTKNQLDYARKKQPWFFAGTKATAPQLNEFVTRDEMRDAIAAAVEQTKTEMLDQFHRLFSDLSSQFHPNFIDFSSQFHPNFIPSGSERLLEVNDSSTDSADFILKHNITKLNETNGAHEEPITASRTHSSERPIKELTSHKGSSTHSEVKKSSGNGNGATTGEQVVSLFQKDQDSAPTGNLEVGDDKFHFVFGSYEKQLERIRKASSTEWARKFDADLGAIARDYERKGIARWTLSPVFEAGDTHGFKAPLPNTAAILCWEGSLLVSCILVIDDGELVFQPINCKKTKTLIWKGRPQQNETLAA